MCITQCVERTAWYYGNCTGKYVTEFGRQVSQQQSLMLQMPAVRFCVWWAVWTKASALAGT
jgi:hypothetical protein